MGLESIIRFIVGLSPSHGQELCGLFVIKQQKVGYRDLHQSVYSCELELVKECSDDSVKSAMAEALINAPVITVRRDGGHCEQQWKLNS